MFRRTFPWYLTFESERHRIEIDAWVKESFYF
jgi:hypothetical protein